MDKRKLLKTEVAISFVKDTFAQQLRNNLGLIPISSPLVVLDGTGINDDLNGIERPVAFPIKALQERKAVVVHSLAKWKRLRLKELELEVGEGILTDMRALRPDEDYTPIHSIYVDQWDWEKTISAEQRTFSFLQDTVLKIYDALRFTEKQVERQYPDIKSVLPEEITFISSEELLQKYPTFTPKERENAIAKEHGAVFIYGIGGILSNGEAHDGRAADYDDWSTENGSGTNGLNGDILVWNPILNTAFELSSMGVRVDKTALERQLKIRNNAERAALSFHKMLLNDELPEAIGGGIGQSRVCMFMLKKAHIGEVQVSIWDEQEKQSLQDKGIHLL
ncbi:MULTISPECIES: aspartate--ammonia ligase [Sphingobacterium]|jgi:aspartate--ammonia ligase|uniref:aspartate--ammonia ligase n=1 Tax=Sphingobacterium TaxID=28453 RepID=UPI000389EBB2|nr:MULTISPECIES: aspartate--ammonia ligase [unclassified Sphingobacterium]KKX50493.1 asparagine synthase [Sphingobacterium sp. IITKGP-BTPF85]MCS3554448.1 aspartate--ammonia ligase [Sphingobacterium sp. JUb21]QQD13260.1 aspartate--ammonia ligase [Sphingobacterium sp. UDSM-2020]TCR07439.1 aspartate-ammonia ligase [Sphingobacterium sp. JUb20]